MKKQIIQMKISLNKITPKIWRRFVVDSSISLHKLHDIIQIVMGWYNAHLYSFTFQETEYKEYDPEDNVFASMLNRAVPKNSKKTKIEDLNLQPG